MEKCDCTTLYVIFIYWGDQFLIIISYCKYNNYRSSLYMYIHVSNVMKIEASEGSIYQRSYQPIMSSYYTDRPIRGFPLLCQYEHLSSILQACRGSTLKGVRDSQIIMPDSLNLGENMPPNFLSFSVDSKHLYSFQNMSRFVCISFYHTVYCI